MSTSNDVVYGNLIEAENYSHATSTIYFSGGSGVSIFDNTIISPASQYAVGLVGQAGASVKNNVVYGPDALFVDPGSESGFTSDYNLFYNSGGVAWQWGTGTDNTLATWNASSGQDVHSTSTNPSFANVAGNIYTLASSSPAIDAGANLGSTYEMGLDPASTWPSNIILDNQNNYGSGWDIGAYVYTDTSTPAVAMTAPANLATVSSIVTVSASSSAVSPAGIASVRFYLDSSSTLLGTATASPYSISWNTATATNGTHTLYALVTDNYSNTATSTSITVTVSNQAVLSVATSTLFSFSAAHGSTATSSQSLVVENAGAASTTLNWSASSTQPWLTFSPASGSLGGGASTSVAFIVNPATLALGTYNATTTIADPAASGSPQTIPVTLAVTDTGISASMTSPTNGATVSGTVPVAATATSTASIASVGFYLDSGSTLLSTATASPYSISWNTATATNGTHTLYAIVTDNYSNTATSTSITVTVSNQAVLSVATSTLFSFSAAHGSTATSSQSLVVENAGAASTTLNWSASSTQPWLTFSPASGSLGGGASTSVAFIVNPATLALGTYNATTTIADPAASGSPQTIPVTLAVTDTGISASMTSPTNGATVSGTVPVAATATSTASIASVGFYLDSGSTLLSTATASPYSISWNTATATNGTHTLYAIVTDNYSNTATSTSITVTVSNQAVLSVGGGGGGGYIVPTPTPTSTPTPTPTPSTTPIGETKPASTGPAAPGAYAPILRLVNDKGTYFLIQNGVLHGIADPGTLSSFGFAFGDAETATAQDLSLRSGNNLSPDDGALVKTAKDPTVYLISGQKRHGFTSASVFRAWGFKFSFIVIVSDPELSALPPGEVISDPKSRHLPGVNVDFSGTIYFLGQCARHPYPSLNVYNSWNLKDDFGKVVRANAADLALPLGRVVEARIVE